MAVVALGGLEHEERHYRLLEALDVQVPLQLVVLAINLGVDDLAHQEHRYQLQAKPVALVPLELGWLECLGLGDLECGLRMSLKKQEGH